MQPHRRQIRLALNEIRASRKPLILARACVLGCLLPATGDLERDLAIGSSSSTVPMASTMR